MNLVEVVKGEATIVGADEQPADANDSDSGTRPSESKGRSHYGVTLGCLSVFVSMVGASFTFPFLQSQRDSLGDFRSD